MAAVTTPEHVETHTVPVAERTQRVESRRVTIDVNLATLIAVGALAITAFTYFNIRIDSVATELRGEIRDVNAKLDKLSAEQRAENCEINARLDRLFELVASQGRRDTQ